MSQWYYSKDGKAHGPVEFDHITASVTKGDLGPLDLVFKIGGTEWQPLNQVPELQKLFQKKEEPPAQTVSKSIPAMDLAADWVILRKIKNEKGTQYKQMGPYSKQQVLELIDKGEILFTDYGWKTGLESWIPINKLEPFKVPLPSTPPVNKTVYDVPGETEITRTEVDFSKDMEATGTSTGQLNEENTSLTELIEIEKYQREKTQVMSPDELKKFWDKNNPKKPAKAEGGDPSQLWSLAPPEDAEAAPQVQEPSIPENTHVDEAKPPKKAKKKKPPKKAKKRRVDEDEDDRPRENRWPWAVAAVVFAVTISFAYFSFMGDSEDSLQADQFSEPVQAPPVVSKPPPPSQDRQQLADLKKQIADMKAQLVQAEKDKQKARLEVQQKAEIEARKQAALAEKKRLEKELAAKKKAAKAKRIAAKKKAAAAKKKAAAAAKKKAAAAARKKAAAAAAKKKAAAAAKKKAAAAAKKKAAAAAAKKKAAAKKVSSAGTVAAVGTFKARSHFLQRDRKALFYASLEAEELVLKLEARFTKLKDRPGEWKSFFRGWKRDAKGFLPPLIKSYPNRSEKYGFSKQLAAFKSDYRLLLQYGDHMNAKVLGQRTPASPEKNLRNVFRSYQDQAKGLGKP